MGVIAHKMPERRTGTVERMVNMFNRFVKGFMDFADVGFRYIDIPKEDESGRPKKKRSMKP